MMKKFLLLLAVAFAAVSCGGKKAPEANPVRDAVVAALLESDPQLRDVAVETFAKVDSSTFAEELARRVSTFEMRRQQDERLYGQYARSGKPKNAQLRYDSLQKDKLVLAGLDSLGKALGARLDDVAFYEYVFTGRGTGENYTVIFDEVYAAVTPDLRVLSVSKKKADLRKTTGRAVPGYEALIKRVPDVGEEAL